MNDRFEVVGVRYLDGEEAVGYFVGDTHGPGANDDLNDLDIAVLHYGTHADARLGADGLRAIGFTIAGIRDRLTGRKVTSAPLKGVSQ